MGQKKESNSPMNMRINQALKNSISNREMEDIKNEKSYMKDDSNGAAATSMAYGRVNDIRINKDAFGGISTSEDIFPEGEGE